MVESNPDISESNAICLSLVSCFKSSPPKFEFQCFMVKPLFLIAESYTVHAKPLFFRSEIPTSNPNLPTCDGAIPTYKT